MKGKISRFEQRKIYALKRCLYKTCFMAFVTVTDNNSLSFELFLFNLNAFLIRVSENIHCSYLALVKKGRSYYTCAGLNCRCCRNFIHSYFLRRRNHCTTRRFLSSQDPDKTAEPGVVVSFLGNSRIVIQRIYIFVSSYCTISLGEIILPTRFWTRCFFVLWFTNFLSK